MLSLVRKSLTTAAQPPTAPGALSLLDRDHSILAFNARVLDWAVRDDVPLIERLRYLCIVSSNLVAFLVVGLIGRQMRLGAHFKKFV